MNHRFYVKLNRIVGFNLFIWMAMAGAVTFEGSIPRFIKVIAWAGVVFAALVQHWAYYADEREPSTSRP